MGNLACTAGVMKDLSKDNPEENNNTNFRHDTAETLAYIGEDIGKGHTGGNAHEKSPEKKGEEGVQFEFDNGNDDKGQRHEKGENEK